MGDSMRNRDVPTSALAYRPMVEGSEYWICDNFLDNPDQVVSRCLSRQDWELGAPRRAQAWPGMRSADALLPDELRKVEQWVQSVTGSQKLWQETAPDGAHLNHNCAQLVGCLESGPRPHTDSTRLCRYAAVIYLTPDPVPGCGTSFYRLRHPDGSLGGNVCPAPHANLREALGVTGLPLDAWHEELAIDNVFNRIVLYRADIVHSATAYFGLDHDEKRLTAVFFWMAQ